MDFKCLNQLFPLGDNIMQAKKQSKIKRFLYNQSKFFRRYKKIIFIAIALIVSPIVVGLFYKIPINFVDIEIGDLLSFYAVAIGLFASYFTYSEDKKQRAREKRKSFRPKIDLTLELDDCEVKTHITLNNQKDKDYIVVYISHDYFDETTRYPLNAKNNLEIVLECWDEQKPKNVYIEVKDEQGDHWNVGFELQESTNTYCRIFVDPV